MLQYFFIFICFKIYANAAESSNSSAIIDTTTTNNATTTTFNPIDYLINYGYLNSLSSLKIDSNNQTKPNSATTGSLKKAIKNFQKFSNLNQTGTLDSPTIERMKLPRCGNQDFKQRKQRYVLQGSKWAKNKLRWKVTKYPVFSTMSNELFDEELRRAFNLWSSVSGLEFEQIKFTSFYDYIKIRDPSELKIDIEIRFESGFHGDSEPFDGPGLILGHAFFPEFYGSMHFDADEIWTSRRLDGVNFYQVAVHELGHALGLEHSDNYEAIMAPFFRGYTDDFRLHNDDIIAIEQLYGKNYHNKILINDDKIKFAETTTSTTTTTKTTTTTTTTIATTKSKHSYSKLKYLCSDGNFDAITQLSDFNTYIFKGPYVFKFDIEHKLFNDYPKLISSVFRDWAYSGYVTLPNNLDAVLYLPDNKTTYFFKNNLYWKSSALHELDPGYPRLISADFKGLNARNGFSQKLDAAFVWSGNKLTYFISENKYWRFDFASGWVEQGYPKDLSYWKGLGSKITSAFLYDDKTYFFKNNYFYPFNDQMFKIENEFFPKLNQDFWFFCN